MLDGWYFGERESDFAVAGFVPSIKREGKITPFDPPSVHSTKPFRNRELRKAHRRRGLLKNKQAPIPRRVNHEVALRKAIRVGSDTEHVLNETERNIKFGLFVITLMFFQVWGRPTICSLEMCNDHCSLVCVFCCCSHRQCLNANRTHGAAFLIPSKAVSPRIKSLTATKILKNRNEKSNKKTTSRNGNALLLMPTLTPKKGHGYVALMFCSVIEA